MIRCLRLEQLSVVAVCAGLCGALPAGPRLSRGERVPVVDLHVDLSYQHSFKDKAFERGSGQFPASALRAGGVVGVVLPLYVPANVSPSGPRASDLERSYGMLYAALTRTPPYVLPGCGSVPPGSVRTFLAFEGAGPLADSPDDLVRWTARGLRIVGLVHRSANELASSSGDRESKSFGLTARGQNLVRRAFTLGLAVDVSHASDRAVAEVLSLAEQEHGSVIATHSNARALAPSPRNLTDAQLAAIAATGGVIGVNFHSRFLVSGRRARLLDVVAQVRHMLSVAGEDHVALGSDFEGDIEPPRGLEDATRYPALAEALQQAGLSVLTVQKIFSRNALRVLCGSAASELSPGATK